MSVRIPDHNYFDYLQEEFQSSQSKHPLHKRISLQKKQKLMEKIVFQNMRIKQAAAELCINYSSAKTILRATRKKFRKNKLDSKSKLHQSEIQDINEKKSYEIFIVNSIGSQNKHEAHFYYGNLPQNQKSNNANDSEQQDMIEENLQQFAEYNQLLKISNQNQVMRQIQN